MDRAGRESRQLTSYDVYVKGGVDWLGRDEFGSAVAHFVEQGNAVALKRRLEARGEIVHVERTTVFGLSESEKQAWFSDYSLVPEFEPLWDREAVPGLPSSSQISSGDQSEGAKVAPPHAAHDASTRRREPWWRRMTGGQ